jgi:lysozyme
MIRLTRDQIRALQRALNARGAALAVDGIDGPLTKAAAYSAILADVDTTPDTNTEILIAELLRDEGFVPHAYQDSLGYWTIGIGRLIDKRKGGGISRMEADFLKFNDIAYGRLALDAKIPWWRELDPVRQRAVQNMAFQLGTGDMGGATFNLIRDGKYAEASDRLKTWKWARQTPARAGRVIKMIRTGKV